MPFIFDTKSILGCHVSSDISDKASMMKKKKKKKIDLKFVSRWLNVGIEWLHAVLGLPWCNIEKGAGYMLGEYSVSKIGI